MPPKRDPTVDSLWGYIFGGSEDQAEADDIRVLGGIPPFQKLSRKELKKVREITHDRRYAPGEYLFHSGQPGAAMFVIKSGSVEIVVPDDGEGETVLATLADSMFLGELALLDDSPRSASARAVEPTEASALFRSDFDRFLQTEPEIGIRIMRQLALVIGQRLKATNDQLSTLSTGPHGDAV